MFFCTVSFVFGGDNRGGGIVKGGGGRRGSLFIFFTGAKKGPVEAMNPRGGEGERRYSCY